ncbi:MAG: cobalamin biosynthesis protein P47K [Rhodospirillaceae bacterium]|nr:cobalamin biosynthesis protein P47K [Rhodospirillaceae bacterium]
MPAAPANLITGFLGVGKTTAIRSLLDRKPTDQNWAVLVNEFGDIGIDGAELGGDSDRVRMVPGGCICCVGNVAMGVALADLIRKQRPDRILIEPTGLGHPTGILDLLREAEQAGQISLHATICLVDPRRIDELSDAESEVFQDQIHMADVLIGHKWDLADDTDRQAFDDWAKKLFPPKGHLTTASQGEFDMALLDLDPDPTRVALFPEAHADPHYHHAHDPNHELAPGRPLRAINQGQGHVSCGWLFAPEEVFDRRRLLGLLTDLEGILRLKGVFRTGRHWMLIDRVGDELSRATIAYRRDSRIECIAEEENAPDWDALEASLVACLRPRAKTTQ